jgi:hypothetical protein
MKRDPGQFSMIKIFSLMFIMNLVDTGYYFVSYNIALAIVTTVLIYVLDLPGYMTGANKLVKEYYYDNALESYKLDVVLILFYIIIGTLIARFTGSTTNPSKLLSVIAACIIISGGFMIAFQKGYKKGSFFSRWFAKVGWHAVAYDIVLICSVYLLTETIQRRFFSQDKP